MMEMMFLPFWHEGRRRNHPCFRRRCTDTSRRKTTSTRKTPLTTHFVRSGNTVDDHLSSCVNSYSLSPQNKVLKRYVFSPSFFLFYPKLCTGVLFLSLSLCERNFVIKRASLRTTTKSDDRRGAARKGIRRAKRRERFHLNIELLFEERAFSLSRVFICFLLQ